MTNIPAPGADLATDELLPCPFCGGAAMLDEHPAHSHAGGIAGFMADYPGSFTIECMASKDCNTGQIANTRAEVVAMWNRRANLAAVPASEPVLAWAVFDATGKLDQIVYSELFAKHHALESKGRYAPMGEIAAPAPVSGMPDLAKLKSDVMRAANQWASAEWADAQNIGRGGPSLEKRCNAAELKVYKAVGALAAARLPAPQAPDTTTPNGETK